MNQYSILNLKEINQKQHEIQWLLKMISGPRLPTDLDFAKFAYKQPESKFGTAYFVDSAVSKGYY